MIAKMRRGARSGRVLSSQCTHTVVKDGISVLFTHCLHIPLQNLKRAERFDNDNDLVCVCVRQQLQQQQKTAHTPYVSRFIDQLGNKVIARGETLLETYVMRCACKRVRVEYRSFREAHWNDRVYIRLA